MSWTLERIRALEARVKRLEAIVEVGQQTLADFSDIEDGGPSGPRPNWAMRLEQEIEEVGRK